MSDSAPRPSRLYLLRHALVAEKHRDRFNGRTEAVIDPREGRAQTEAMAVYLDGTKPAAIYTSPLKRCLQSAEPLERRFGLKSRVEPGLREMDFGVFDGLSFDQIRQGYPEEMKAWYADLADYRLPQAETMAEVQERAWRAVEGIVNAHPAEAVAVVAHGAVNRLILARILGLDINQVLTLAQDYACLNILDFYTEPTVVRGVTFLPKRVVIKGVNIRPGEHLPLEVWDRT